MFIQRFLLVGLAVIMLCGRASACGTEAEPMSPKVPDVVRQQVQRIEQVMGAADSLSPVQAATLSSPLLQVDRDGRLLLRLHAAGAVGERERKQIEALGATAASSTADVKPASGVALPPKLGVIEAWVPHCRVDEVAVLDWVVAITPAERGKTDRPAALDTPAPAGLTGPAATDAGTGAPP
jgi:hypothetical protein